MGRLRRLVGLLLCALVLLGCESQGTARTARGSEPGFDVQRVVQRAHLAFHAEAHLFTGGHSTYAVSVEGARTRVTPISRAAGAALVLESAELRREGAKLELPAAAALESDGKLVRRGAGVSEWLENREQGVELSWRMPARPAGSGALEVRVPASGLTFVGETESGLHFQDPKSTLGVRVSHATWIDAEDRRMAVRARWDGGGVVLSVPAEIVNGAAYPVVLDPLIGPEVAVDVPVSGTASGIQSNASVAYDGTNYFVVWEDYRSWDYPQVFAARVGADGTLLDPTGILISLPGVTSYSPSVVWDGSDYLVVFATDHEVVGRRLTPDGDPVDATPFLIADVGGLYASSVFAANNGATTLVVWADAEGYSDIYATRVSGATPLDGTSGIAISTAAGDQSSPRATYGGGNWFIVWDDWRAESVDVYGARLEEASGQLLDSVTLGIPIADSPSADEMGAWPASNGQDYFVAWQDSRNGVMEIYGARVEAAGTVTDTIAVCNQATHQSGVSVAFNGGNYQAVWLDYYGLALYGNRIVPSTGEVLDGASGALLASGAANFDTPRLFATGTDFYLAWSESESAAIPQRLMGSRMTTTPVLQDAPGLDLTSSANGQHTVDVASDGNDRWFVVWQDDRAGASGIYGVRVDGSGAALDPEAILISPGGFYESVPAVAYNGTHFLVVWHDLGGILGARVDALTGDLVDGSGLELFVLVNGNMPYEPDVASDGSRWLVTWEDRRNGYSAIYAGFVEADGSVSKPGGFPVSTLDGPQLSPQVVFGGDRYLVVWNDQGFVWQDTILQSVNDLYGARVTPDGIVEDPSGIPIEAGAGSSARDDYAVAYADGHFLVVHGDGEMLEATRLSEAGGELVSTTEVVPCCATRPSVAFDGERFLAVYATPGSAGFELKATRFASDGTDLDAVDFSVQGGAVDSHGASIAALPERVLAAYSHYDSTPGAQSDRVFTRLISGLPAGAACSIDDDCASDSCADGVCCDSACGDSDVNDCQACSVAAGATIDGVCEPIEPGAECRPAAGPCDWSESCDGVSSACPEDLFEVAGTVCRAEVPGGCDAPEVCSGSAAECPDDVLAQVGTVCRDSLGVCDPAESCTGSSASCPEDELALAGSSCRVAVGACDVEETCTGDDVDCPSDELEAADAECRPSAGSCDPAEFCSGVDGSCPPDELAPALSECRPAAGSCDVAEHCTGVGAACPSDKLVPAGTECHASAGDCDPAESCTGSAPGCPADALSPPTTVCRPAAGACDVSESCTGLDAACPPNARHSASHVCRAAAGDECDFEEKCDGASDACPADVTEVDGSSCEVACTLASQCSAGVCVLSAKRLGLWPTTLEFADTFVGEKTDSQAVTMVNQMAATLEITTIDDSGEFPVVHRGRPAVLTRARCLGRASRRLRSAALGFALDQHRHHHPHLHVRTARERGRHRSGR
ncbi:MAG TPA: hypothetical protein VM686_36160 [Polyangiaceae bacterium]|nr:hypothetical protein [Polyangiaceae bacterium]